MTSGDIGGLFVVVVIAWVAAIAILAVLLYGNR
jgi:hypothetical protein